jgi:ATP-binding cassette subfamily F protein 3
VRAREERREAAARKPARAAKANGSAKRGGPAPKAGPSKNQLARRASLEEQIAAAEATLATLEDELADPAHWADPERSAESTQRHQAAKRTVEELYERLAAAER